MTEKQARAEGYATMAARLMGCIAPGHLPAAVSKELAPFYLRGMLARLDATRESIVKDIEKRERAIEEAAEAASESYRQVQEQADRERVAQRLAEMDVYTR